MKGISCSCLNAPSNELTLDLDLGMDDRFAEVVLLSCPRCGRRWLRYFYELEAFSRSGRWYLGILTSRQVAALTAGNARETLAQLDWFFYGGSYFDGRWGRASGRIEI